MQLFTKEHQLVSAFALRSDDFLRSLLNKSVSKYFLLQEFDSYFGVADLVLGTFKKGAMRRLVREPVNPNWVASLASLKRGTIVTTEEFSKIYGLSKNSATKRLTDYEGAGFLTRLEPGSYRVTRDYEPVTEMVVSVEAKLKDWRKALAQAQRYRRFSDYSFVLLDGAKSAAAINNIGMFEALNIGLISLTDDELELHFVPKKNEKKMSEYYLRVNEVAYDQFTSTKRTY